MLLGTMLAAGDRIFTLSFISVHDSICVVNSFGFAYRHQNVMETSLNINLGVFKLDDRS